MRPICCQSVSKGGVVRAGDSSGPWQGRGATLVKGDAGPVGGERARACPALRCQKQLLTLKDRGLAHLERYLKWGDRVTAGPATCSRLWDLNVRFLGAFFDSENTFPTV